MYDRTTLIKEQHRFYIEFLPSLFALFSCDKQKTFRALILKLKGQNILCCEFNIELYEY